MYKYYAKLLALRLSPILVILGIHKLASRFWGGKGHILMFHRVIPIEKRNRIHNHLSLEVSPNHLEKIIRYFIKCKYDIISLDQIHEYQDSNKKYVVFTFDDGYKDNLKYAYPIFKKFSCPFTIYVCNAFPNGNAFLWWYLLEEMLLNLEFISINTENFFLDRPINTIKKKESAFNQVRDAVNNGSLSLDELEALFSKWDEKWNVKMVDLCLSWNDIKQLSIDPLVTIGAHTLSHKALKVLPKSEALSEILGSKEELESILHMKVEHFAYPFGSRKEVSQRDVQIVNEIGFKTATTTILGNVNNAQDDRNQFPRITVNSQTSISVLKMQLSGVYGIIDNGAKGGRI